MSFTAFLHTGDNPVPVPTTAPSMGDVHYPALPTGQGFHFAAAAATSAQPFVVALLVTLLAAVIATSIAILFRLPKTSGARRAAVSVAVIASLLATGVATFGIAARDTSPAAAGYSQFHKWAEDRYSVNIGAAGYQTLLTGQPTTTAYMGARTEVTLVHGDDGLGYLFTAPISQELTVKPNAYGRSTQQGLGENGSGTGTTPGGAPIGTPVPGFTTK